MEIPKGIPGISKIIFANDLGNTPAICYRDSRVVKLNSLIWPTLSENHQYFILAHEAGHIVLDTDSEQLADDFAFKIYAKSGRPLSESILALSKVLTFQNFDHYLRVNDALKRALIYDYVVNGNEKAKPNNMYEGAVSAKELESSFLGGIFSGAGLGLTKASREKRDLLFQEELKKKDAKTNLINARASKKEDTGAAKLVNATATQILAEQGIAKGGILGGEQRLAGDAATEEKLLGMPKKTAIIVIVVVSVVVVGVAAYFLLKKN